jgi:hypothetical protein
VLTGGGAPPVNTIVLMANNANPNTVYPGTTWVRIPNGYLRNNGENTALGIGGSLTTNNTALTVGQLPSHNHGGTLTSSNGGAWTATMRQGSSNGIQAIWNVSGTGRMTVGGGISAGTRFTSHSATHTADLIGENAHSHTVAITANGSGEGHNHTYEPSFVNVYAWRRTT